MANRPTSGATGRQNPAPARSTQPQPHARQSTARVAVLEARSPLPSWFWGALGCLSVLGVGFAVLFVAIKPAAEEAAPAAASAPVVAPAPRASAAPAPPAAPARPAPGAPARGAGIHVEQIAAPPPPALADMPRPAKPRPPRAIKVAKTPAAAPKEAAPAARDDEADEAEVLAPRPKRAAAARAADEESEEKTP